MTHTADDMHDDSPVSRPMTTIDSLDAALTRVADLERRLRYRDEQVAAFYNALAELPECPPVDLLVLLSGPSYAVASTGDIADRGLALQRKFGLAAVPPKAEYQWAAGLWSVIRDAVAALSTPSPVLADEGVMWTEVHPRGFYAYTRFGRYDVNGPFDEGTDGPWSWQLLQFSHDVTDRQTAPTEQDAKLAALADYRDRLGRIVREAWVKWARTQPKPKPSWLVPYDDLSEPDKEADRQIGEAVVALPTPPALTP